MKNSYEKDTQVLYKIMLSYINQIFPHCSSSTESYKLKDRVYNNIIVIWAHLLAVLYAKYKENYSAEDAENIAKYLNIKLLIEKFDMCEEDLKIYLEYISNVITKMQAIRRLILSGKEFQDSSFQEEVSNSIFIDILYYDVGYFLPNSENKLIIENIIAEIKKFEEEINTVFL